MAETLNIDNADEMVDAHADHGDDHHDHPSDWHYVKIALWLAGLTAVEVLMFVFEEEIGRTATFVGLTLLMIIKFVLVIEHFMHLKYDTKWFRYVFVSGLILAIVVYAIVFLAYDVFWGGDTTFENIPAVELEAEE